MNVYVLLILSLLAISDGEGTADKGGENVIPNQFIVVFKNGTSEAQRNAFYEKYFTDTNRWDDQNGIQAKVLKCFNINEEFVGFSAVLPNSLMLEIRFSSLVDYVQNDETVELYDIDASDTSCLLQSSAPWGLNRICSRQINLDGNFNYGDKAGEGVYIYILDSGINIEHEDFGGRAIWGTNTADDSIDSDCDGHGTHVAGIAGSSTFGVAKKATLVAVKSVGCTYSTVSASIAGIDWIVADHKASMHPSVINMSLGSRKGTFDAAVKAAINAGIVFVTAAGNAKQDSCLGSPGCVPTAITVGASAIMDLQSQPGDVRASFSNYGSCIDVFAPGDLIESTYIGSSTATKVMSGTSMASPFIAGVAAVYLGVVGNATPAEVGAFLVEQATADILNLQCTEKYIETDICMKSPNKLVFSSC